MAAFVVIDAGRESFMVGTAGEDSPDDDGVWDDRRAMRASGHQVDPLTRHGLANFRTICWQRLSTYLRDRDLQPESTIALISVKLFDSYDGETVAEIADMCFGCSGSQPLFHSITLVPQELMQVYSAGKTTALIVNIGHEITICGVFEGRHIGEMARRFPNPSPPSDWSEERVREEGAPNELYGAATALTSAEIDAFFSSTRLPELVADSILSAPIDLRPIFARSISMQGRRMVELVQPLHLAVRALLPIPSEYSDASHGPAELTYSTDEHIMMATHEDAYPFISMPKSAPYSTWVGGSILLSVIQDRLSGMRPSESLTNDFLHCNNWRSIRLQLPRSPPLWASLLFPADEEMEWKKAAQRRALRFVLSTRMLGRSSLSSLLRPGRDIAYSIATVIAERVSNAMPERLEPPQLGLTQRRLCGLSVVDSEAELEEFAPFAPRRPMTPNDEAIHPEAPALLMIGSPEFNKRHPGIVDRVIVNCADTPPRSVSVRTGLTRV